MLQLQSQHTHTIWKSNLKLANLLDLGVVYPLITFKFYKFKEFLEVFCATIHQTHARVAKADFSRIHLYRYVIKYKFFFFFFLSLHNPGW